MTIARFYAFGGHEVPFRATIFADFVFNLQGAANVALLLLTRRCVPDAVHALPLFAPRKRVSVSSPEAFGITPFVLPVPGAEEGSAEKAEVEDEKRAEGGDPFADSHAPGNPFSDVHAVPQRPDAAHMRRELLPAPASVPDPQSVLHIRRSSPLPEACSSRRPLVCPRSHPLPPDDRSSQIYLT